MPAPPKLVSPSFVKPTIRYVFASCTPASRSLPPIFRWPVSAVWVSIETSESDRGLRPST